jgi:hypothetical protein
MSTEARRPVVLTFLTEVDGSRPGHGSDTAGIVSVKAAAANDYDASILRKIPGKLSVRYMLGMGIAITEWMMFAL